MKTFFLWLLGILIAAGIGVVAYQAVTGKRLFC